ncbi:MAG TPA: pyridoxamine 5'-phosphate oxidase family protein [Candidatus Saccharimonadales bacterium]|nr:pyridoxamine 5'-phosphate oxidase family protein [Candidatus Saccharimonadales bacterium]
MDLKQRIKDYLSTSRVMQLATSSDNKPWACNVHFYADDELNIYWNSSQTRRHSQDIEQNPNVAITIKIHEDTPEEYYIIGLSAEGKASILTDEEIKKIGPSYIKKLNKEKTLVEDVLSGKNSSKFYLLKPEKFVIFDTKNNTGNPRQEFTL